ncbi:hypothetical protein HOE425_331456 [Hoeflea sp. EC-HK425]|nr:hypothetical protein HOE425_331456 [Hoeflea sp. EC-HK425]
MATRCWCGFQTLDSEDAANRSSGGLKHRRTLLGAILETLLCRNVFKYDPFDLPAGQPVNLC